MKKSIIIAVSLLLFGLTSCEEEKENKIPKDVHGYVVEKEIIKAHWDTVKPIVLTASMAFYGAHVSSSHPSFHSSFHSSPHISSHSSYHSSYHSSHPMYRTMYHPVYHPIIYGHVPYHRSHQIHEDTITFIGTEFDLYVANKFSITKVSVDSISFYHTSRGQKVSFKDGKLETSK